MIKEIIIEKAISFEYPPDGDKVPILDPYDGCTMGCPYCFQMNDEEWNKEFLLN